jgi:rod shape-determining protein MreD
VTGRESARVVLVVVTFVLVQETIVLDLRVGEIHADILVLLPILAGLVGGPATGASMGFGTGLVADLFLPTPFGLSALVGTLVGFAVGMATVALDRSSWWLPPAVGLAGSAVYEIVYASIGSLLGQPQMLHVDLVRIVLLVSLVNAVLALPARRLASWALTTSSTEGMPTSSLASAAR